MTKARQWILKAFMFLPLVYMSFSQGVDSLRNTQERAFQYAIILMTATFIGNIWIGLFLAWNVFTFIYAGQVTGQAQLMNVLFGSLLFLFSKNFFSEENFNQYKKYILYIIIMNTVWMTAQRFGVDLIFSPQTNGGVLVPGPLKDDLGFFGIKMANGIFNTMALPILASVNIWLAPLLLIPIYLCQSSSVMLAVGVTGLFYTYHLHRKAFIALLLAIPVGLIAYVSLDLKTDPKTFNSRFPVWASAAQFTLRNANGFNGLVGYGPDSYRNKNRLKDFRFVGDNHYNHGILRELPDGNMEFKYFLLDNSPQKMEELIGNFKNTNLARGEFDEWDNPHNEYVNLLFQYGIVGVLLLGGLVSEMCIRFKHAPKTKALITVTACLLVYFVTSLTHFPVELARVGYLFPIFLGAFYRMTDA